MAQYDESIISKKDLQIINKFLKNKNLLFVDARKSVRSGLHVAITNTFDVKNINIFDVKDKIDAMEIIREKKPVVIISYYDLGENKTGIDIFYEYRENYDEGRNCVCILLVSEDSQSMIAKAAEEEVDGFLILPLNIKTIAELLKSAVETKLETHEYMDLINKGRDLLLIGKFKEAIVFFKEAIKENKKFSIGYYFLGQCLEKLNDSKDAKEMYNKALLFNSMHLKSLEALYELYNRNKEYLEAYDIMKKLCKYFPTEPDRLGKVIHLAIQTENYRDMDLFYEIFTNLKNRDEMSTRYISAGILTATNWFFQNGKADRALEILSKIKTSFSIHTDLLERAIEVLVEHNFMEEAKDFFHCYTGDNSKSKNFNLAYFLVNKDVMSAQQIVKDGMVLINKFKIKNFMVYNMIYKSHLELGNPKSAENLMVEMVSLFPSKFHKVESPL